MKLSKEEKEFIQLKVGKILRPQFKASYDLHHKELDDILVASSAVAKFKDAVRALLGKNEEYDETKLELNPGYGFSVQVRYRAANFVLKQEIDLAASDSECPAPAIYANSIEYTPYFLDAFVSTKCTSTDKRSEAYQSIIDKVSTEIITDYNKKWTTYIDNFRNKVNF